MWNDIINKSCISLTLDKIEHMFYNFYIAQNGGIFYEITSFKYGKYCK